MASKNQVRQNFHLRCFVAKFFYSKFTHFVGVLFTGLKSMVVYKNGQISGMLASLAALVKNNFQSGKIPLEFLFICSINARMKYNVKIERWKLGYHSNSINRNAKISIFEVCNVANYALFG